MSIDLNNINIPSFETDHKIDDIKFLTEKIDDNDLVVKDDVTGTNLYYKTTKFEADKEYFTFIKNVKRMVRNSNEYRTWVDYVKISMGYNKCFLSDESLGEVTLELHHHPISLENVIRIIVDTKLTTRQKFTSFEIAEEIIKLHYEFKIGFVILVTTLHEKFHNGFLPIGLDVVKGDWKSLLNDTIYYIDEDIKTVIDNYARIKTTDKIWLAYHKNQISSPQ